jgi:hypothetical protein
MLNRMILLAVAAAIIAAPVAADAIVEDVSFDCTGELVRIVDTDAGPRATSLVEITAAKKRATKKVAAKQAASTKVAADTTADEVVITDLNA